MPIRLPVFLKLSKITKYGNTAQLRVEELESRLAPVVGYLNRPDEVLPGGQYDGVVSYTSTDALTSGSLIKTGDGWGWGHHILTVGHSIANLASNNGPSDLNVKFDLARGGVAVPIIVNVPKNVLNGSQYQVQHTELSGAAPRSNDIGILILDSS